MIPNCSGMLAAQDEFEVAVHDRGQAENVNMAMFVVLRPRTHIPAPPLKSH